MQPGSIVAGRYEITAKLGGGGMGQVFRAVHRVSRREIALKLIVERQGHTTESAVRFQREASAPAAIGHPGIVEVYDAGVDPQSGAFFIAMELLLGPDLRERMGPAAVAWIFELLEPLAAAHAKGFVHRDLKPENVIIDRSTGVERIKLVDFGLARRPSDLAATGTGVSMGTLFYMAPEQMMSARDAGPTADVFSIGVMLYEAWSGRRPFEAPSLPAVLVQMQTVTPAPLQSLVPGFPPALGQLVQRCLAFDPTHRPPTASALRAELAPLLAQLPGLGAYAHPHRSAARTAAAIAPTLPAPEGSRARPDTPPATRARLGCVLAAIATSLVGAIAIGVVGVVLSSEPSTSEVTDHGLTVVDGDGFRVGIPSGWQTAPRAHEEYVLQYAEPSHGGVQRQVAVATYPHDGTVDDVMARALRGVRESGRVELDRRATMAGHPAREAQFWLSHSAGDYRQLERACVVSGRAWLLTCVGPAEEFASQASTCRAFFDSLVLDGE